MFFPKKPPVLFAEGLEILLEWLEEGLRPVVWLQAGATFAGGGFFGPTKAACVRRSGLTAPAAGRSSREGSRTQSGSMVQAGSCLLLEVGFALRPWWVASRAETGVRLSAGLQDCSLFTALPAGKCRSRVGLSVLQLRVLCFVLNRKYNTIVFI